MGFTHSQITHLSKMKNSMKRIHFDPSAFNKLTSKEKDELRKLDAHQETKLKQLARKCNNKENCETGEQVSGIRLEDACPNEKFVKKHIAPARIESLSQLPEYAKKIEKEREKKTSKQNFFFGAVHMEYKLDGSDCVFETPAENYLCTKKCDNGKKTCDCQTKDWYAEECVCCQNVKQGYWECEHVGQEIARHNAENGHYESLKKSTK